MSREIHRTHITNLRFLGKGSNVTITGHFVNGRGARVGDSFTATILKGDGVNEARKFATLFGDELPEDAEGFIGTLTGDVYVDAVVPASGEADDFKTNYARYPIAHANVAQVVFGRVRPANQTPEVQFRGGAKVVGVELTRPADTTAYAAKDVISANPAAYLTFAGLARFLGGSGYIVKARAMTDKKDWTGRIRLHLFHTAPTAIADNSPYLLLYVNKDKRVGQIDFPAMSTEDATNSTAAAALNDLIRMHFKCADDSRDLYALVEVLDAQTPANGQKFYFELSVDQD